MINNKRKMPKDLFFGPWTSEIGIVFCTMFIFGFRGLSVFITEFDYPVFKMIIMLIIFSPTLFVAHSISHKVSLEDRIISQYEPEWSPVTPEVFNEICTYKKNCKDADSYAYRIVALVIFGLIFVFMSFIFGSVFVTATIVLLFLFVFVLLYSKYLECERWTRITESAEFCYVPATVIRIKKTAKADQSYVFINIVYNGKKYMYECFCSTSPIVDRLLVVSDGSHSAYFLPRT